MVGTLNSLAPTYLTGRVLTKLRAPEHSLNHNGGSRPVAMELEVTGLSLKLCN